MFISFLDEKYGEKNLPAQTSQVYSINIEYAMLLLLKSFTDSDLQWIWMYGIQVIKFCCDSSDLLSHTVKSVWFPEWDRVLHTHHSHVSWNKSDIRADETRFSSLSPDWLVCRVNSSKKFALRVLQTISTAFVGKRSDWWGCFLAPYITSKILTFQRSL